MEVFIITPFPNTINVLIENNITNQGIKKTFSMLKLSILEILLMIITKKLMMSLTVEVVEW